MSKALPPRELGVPWNFSSSGDYAQWQWNDPGAGGRGAFNALIVRAGFTFRWEVRTPGGAVLGRGATTDKDACEAQILSCVGKAFANLTLPLTSVLDAANRASVRAKIAQAAGCYDLADGERHDLRDLNASLVDVCLINGTTYTGMLRTGEWALILDVGDEDLVVHPTHVTTIVRVP